jgi:hypothetical protein
MPQTDKLLLASIHDVGPRFESEVDQLADRIERRIGSKRFAMLVVPDHWGETPLKGHPSFRRGFGLGPMPTSRCSSAASIIAITAATGPASRSSRQGT